MRLVPHLCLWALRRETPAAACFLASIRAAQALETGPEPPSDGAESSSSTSDELWSPSSGDPPCEPGAFMAPFLSIISEQNHAQPSILCLYFAICQVRCPCRHSDSRNSPRAPATPFAGAQHPHRASLPAAVVGEQADARAHRAAPQPEVRPPRPPPPVPPPLAPLPCPCTRRAQQQQEGAPAARCGTGASTPSAPARCSLATSLCSRSSPRLGAVLDRRGLPPEPCVVLLGPTQAVRARRASWAWSCAPDRGL